MTALSTQPYKGTRDFFPQDMRFRRWMFGKLRQVAELYGYEEYDGPMLEPFELYAAKTGEEIVNQQLYWMIDRGERKIAVRPEMTPTLARLVASKIHELPRPIRWFSIPNLWRYERPQRGRLREHWQLNMDVLGGESLLADAEIIQVALDLMGAFGGGSKVQVKVNNRRLIDHFFSDRLRLPSEVALGATKAIDARAKIGEEAYTEWLKKLGLNDEQRKQMESFFTASFEEILKSYPCQGTQELAALFDVLKDAVEQGQVGFDPQVLRGMDYYTGTVFEIYDISPENRRALFGGGRYDNLVGLFGNHKLSGVGFGMGDVGLQNFLETHQLTPKIESAVDVMVTLPKPELREASNQIARTLREAGLRTITPLGTEGFGAQLKLASKHKARWVVLLGESEWQKQEVVLKRMADGHQETLALTRLAARLREE